jgi:hypothetical protein
MCVEANADKQRTVESHLSMTIDAKTYRHYRTLLYYYVLERIRAILLFKLSCWQLRGYLNEF